MNRLVIVCAAILLIICSINNSLAQRPTLTPARTPAPVDSTRQGLSPADTIPTNVRRNGVQVGTSVLRPDLDSTTAAPDTAQVSDRQEAKIRKIIPRKATIRSLILPGLGQIYNRQYWKVPLIYGGLAFAVYAFQFNQTNYIKYENGYREAYNLPDSLINKLYNAKTAIVDGKTFSITTLQNATNQFHQQRDLTIILTAVGWALQAVEANVAAHLKTFDLTDDISMKITPTVLPVPSVGAMPGIRVVFRFN